MKHNSSTVKQPVFFIPHGGGPCFFMDWNPKNTWDGMQEFLASIMSNLPQRPSAILLVSAHWLEPTFSITAAALPDLIYDYYGFPEHTYNLKYPAPGSPNLAIKVSELLSRNAVATKLEFSRGFDHGMFIPLKVMHPEADIPVVQLSLQQNLDANLHINVGKLLEPLRDEGVLIVGSGMSFHNMRGYGDSRYTAPSVEFDDWLTQAVSSDAKEAALADWEIAPYALDCHPKGACEHLIPLMVAAGAAGQDKGVKVYSEQVMKTQLSAFRFG